MGEGQSKINSAIFSKANPLIQKYLAPKPKVSPYREGMPAPAESILQVFVARNNYVNVSQGNLNNVLDFAGNEELSSKPPHALGDTQRSISKMSTKLINQPSFEEFREEPQPLPQPQLQPQPIQRAPSNVEARRPMNEPALERTQSRYLMGESYPERQSSPTIIAEERERQLNSSMRSAQVEDQARGREPNLLVSRGNLKKVSYVDQTQEVRRSKSPVYEAKSKRSDEDDEYEYKYKAEKRFSPAELQILKENFGKFARDNKLTKPGLLKLLSLEDFEDNLIGARIYTCVRQMSSRDAVFGNYVNYERFIQAVGILARGDAQEKLEFIYNIFDASGEGQVTSDEMLNVLGGLFRVLRSMKFEHQNLNTLNERINDISDDEVEDIFEDIVKDIVTTYGQDQNSLSFEEWKAWFTGQFGMFDVLNYKIKRVEF